MMTAEEIFSIPLPGDYIGEVLLEWLVPENLREGDCLGTPDAYRVTLLDPKRGTGGCIIWGCYGTDGQNPEWKPNISARALVSYLLQERFSNPKQEILQIARIGEIEPGDVLVVTVAPGTPPSHVEHMVNSIADAAQASVIVTDVGLDIDAYDGKHLPKLLELTKHSAS